uniref:(northern house mosquito) hypothetical protein n=2 Tax=Culex pipiens complex TaxID=518105 RepID=A0A8D8ESX3_CULPI
MLHYDINDDDLLNERNYGPSDYGGDRDRGGGGGGMIRGDSRDIRDLRERDGRVHISSGVSVGVASSSNSNRHTLNADMLDHDRELIRGGGGGDVLVRGELVRGDPRDPRYPIAQPQQLVAPPSSQSVRRAEMAAARERGASDGRDRDDYSPHRGGGNNRRVLNAM